MNEHLTHRDTAALRSAKTIVLTSYKRDGTPVPTPVSLAADGDRLFFRSHDHAWKTKRLRNNPTVEVTPSTLTGRPTGDSVGARAVRLEGEEATTAARALARRHRVLQGALVPVVHRLARYRTIHYELRLDGAVSQAE
jgi:uncharacterized protein